MTRIPITPVSKSGKRIPPDPRAALQELPASGESCKFCGQIEDTGNSKNLFVRPAIWDDLQEKAIWVAALSPQQMSTVAHEFGPGP